MSFRPSWQATIPLALLAGFFAWLGGWQWQRTRMTDPARAARLWLAVAVATYLPGLAFARERPPPRHEWHALAIGALTVAAFRSKEVGAVLLLWLVASVNVASLGVARAATQAVTSRAVDPTSAPNSPT